MKLIKKGMFLFMLGISSAAIAGGAVNIKNGLKINDAEGNLVGGYKIKWTVHVERVGHDYFVVQRPDYTKEYSGTLSEGPSKEFVRVLSLPDQNGDERLRSIKLEWLKEEVPAHTASFDFRDEFGNFSEESWDFDCRVKNVNVYEGTGDKRMKLATPLAWEPV